MTVAARRVDLNADVGEAEGGVQARSERQLLDVVTTAHVACGYHAGDAASMRRTVAAAVASGVVVGAHPSYPDRAGFGRLDMERAPGQVATDVRLQVESLSAVARECRTAVLSVKAHGALYHRMSRDDACVSAVARTLAGGAGVPVVLVLPAGAATAGVPGALGVPVVTEAFCDRRYRSDGTLVPRSDPSSVITDALEAVDQALSVVLTGMVTPVEGPPVPIRCDTLCVHGDTPGAGALATGVRLALEAAGVTVSPYAVPSGPRTAVP
ncbi:MAG: 5-oxoprolinase subunit PxpA [Acidimicrobiales bacterium]